MKNEAAGTVPFDSLSFSGVESKNGQILDGTADAAAIVFGGLAELMPMQHAKEMDLQRVCDYARAAVASRDQPQPADTFRPRLKSESSLDRIHTIQAAGDKGEKKGGGGDGTGGNGHKKGGATRGKPVSAPVPKRKDPPSKGNGQTHKKR